MNKVRKTFFGFYVLIFCLIQIPFNVSAQAKAKIDLQRDSEVKAINNYIEYLNKSMHGLYIINLLLENENHKINKFVDLESHIMENIENDMFSHNVFTDHDFYERTIEDFGGTVLSQEHPFELADRAKKESTVLPKEVSLKWNAKIDEINLLLNRANEIRFEIVNYLGSHNLNNREDVYGAYEILESARDLYGAFYVLESDFYSDLVRFYKSKYSQTDNADLIKAMSSLHKASRLILDALRFTNDNSFDELIAGMNKATEEFKLVSRAYTSNPKYKNTNLVSNFKKIQRKCQLVISTAQEFLDSGTVAEKYKLYGKYYYYHNNKIAFNVDWFGSGFIQEMNNILVKMRGGFLSYDETPVFFKVIYPEKLDTLQQIASTDPMIDRIPRKLKNREIKESKHTILADGETIELKLFDHMIQDGDIVSINFNGDWILEKHSIENKAEILTLKLNPKGKNYLLLHADSEGRRPPNTLGIKYTYQGETKEIQLKSSLKTSELIEIRSN